MNHSLLLRALDGISREPHLAAEDAAEVVEKQGLLPEVWCGAEDGLYSVPDFGGRWFVQPVVGGASTDLSLGTG